MLGRVSACDVHVVDGEVSREHAMIVREGGVVTLVDLDSTNGTFVGGERIRNHQLRSGDLFTIAGSRFVFEGARRGLSAQPMLRHRVQTPADDEQPPTSSQERQTQQMGSVSSEDGVSSPLRDTAETPAAEDAEDEFESRTTMELAKASEPAPQTVRLEAAEPEVSPDKKTAELGVVDAPTRATVESEPATPTREAVPVFFPPPPLPSEGTDADAGSPTELEYTAAPAVFSAPATARPKTDYDGDLVADISTYRSFRLRLQRDEIPTGEEVSAMIDLEARLRGPKPDDDPMRDVIAQRFFKRFDFEAPVVARFKLSRQTVHLEGTIADLSVDGLRCSMGMEEMTPVRDQFAVLLIEGEMEGVCVQYAFTSRVVWVKSGKIGFVFAGAPSWKERSSGVEDAKTDVTGYSRSARS